MLTSAKLSVPDETLRLLADIISNGQEEVEEVPGVYRVGHFNFDHQILNLKSSERYGVPNWAGRYPEFDDELNAYGVADTIEQVLASYATWLRPDCPRKFCVSYVLLDKHEQPSEGGWRWHKWGPYIGTKQPQCEYLYDEGNDIQSVVVYHIYELE